MDYTIDMKEMVKREEFHDAVERILPVPGYYGRNLDALFDFLTEKRDELHINLVNCRRFRENNWEYFNLIETVLKDSKVSYDIDYEED